MANANPVSASLALVSARVNCRKTLGILSRGDTSLRSLKPIAVNLAKTSLLFQGMELNVTNDTYRWAPPKPVTITPNSPASYDPSTKLTIEHRWAVRWVRDFMTLLHERRTESTTHSTELNDVGNGVLAFGMMLEFRSHSTVHLIGDTSAYSCDMVMFGT